jgi:hypothetical protein
LAAKRAFRAAPSQAAALVSTFLICAPASFGALTSSTPFAMLTLTASESMPAGADQLDRLTPGCIEMNQMLKTHPIGNLAGCDGASAAPLANSVPQPNAQKHQSPGAATMTPVFGSIQIR